MKKLLWLALAMICATASVRAQDTQIIIRESFDGPAVRILQDYILKAGDSARAVAVIGGDATIDGHVDGDVVVVLGKAQLGEKAVVDGAFVVIGGTGTIKDGAQIRRDIVVIGALDAPGTFSPGGNQVVVGGFSRLRGLVPWLTRGLVWGRLIVPGLGWVWLVAAVFFLINLFLNVLFDGPVRACTRTLAATPLSAFITGLLVMLLAGPVCVILAISVVGIAIIPILNCAMLLAIVIGKIGFARWIGMGLVEQPDMENRTQSTRSFLIGSAVMCIAYMIPVLGLMTWALAAVFGLGAATQAFFRAYRRENPKPPKKTEPVPVPPPAPPADVVAEAPLQMAVAPDVAFAGPPPAPAAAAAVTSDLLAFPRATFFERLAAFGLDFVLLAIVAQVIRLDRLFEGRSAFESNLLLLGLVYHIGFWAWKQTTVGGIICQLRVVRIDGGPLRLAEAVVRALSGIFSLAVVGVGFLWILRDPERQAWHDRIAGTYVVKVPRNWPI